jgi:AraC-like DNA-binding protein
MPTIPHFRFETNQLPPEQRLPYWKAGSPNWETTLPDGMPADQFQATATAWFMGDIVVTQASVSAVRLRRSSALILADGNDNYHFFMTTRGSWRGRLGERDVAGGAGQLVAFDLREPFETDGDASDSLAIVVARAALDRLLSAEPDLHGHVFSGGSGALLTEYLLALVRNLPLMEESDAPAIAAATLGHIAAAVKTLRRRDSGEAAIDAIRHQARRHIERHLTDTDLGPDRLAEEIGVSRSALYRSFEPLGGVAAYVQRRRLEAAHLMLLNPEERRSIGELADAFGFTSASHFASAFRRTYGLTPRDVRLSIKQDGASDMSLSRGSDLLRPWMKGLPANV